MKISEHLRELGLEEIHPIRYSVGLCEEIECRFGVSVPEEFFKSWDGFSGDSNYPVPAPQGYVDLYGTLASYKAYHMEQDLWIGEYGDDRRELCLHLANEYERIGK